MSEDFTLFVRVNVTPVSIKTPGNKQAAFRFNCDGEDLEGRSLQRQFNPITGSIFSTIKKPGVSLWRKTLWRRFCLCLNFRFSTNRKSFNLRHAVRASNQNHRGLYKVWQEAERNTKSDLLLKNCSALENPINTNSIIQIQTPTKG